MHRWGLVGYSPWDSLGKNTAVDLPCLSPGYLPDPGIKPESPAAPALKAESLPLSHRGSPDYPKQF